MKNEILEDIWRIKDEHARKYNYDVVKMCEALMKQQKKNKNLIRLPSKRRRSA